MSSTASPVPPHFPHHNAARAAQHRGRSTRETRWHRTVHAVFAWYGLYRDPSRTTQRGRFQGERRKCSRSGHVNAVCTLRPGAESLQRAQGAAEVSWTFHFQGSAASAADSQSTQTRPGRRWGRFDVSLLFFCANYWLVLIDPPFPSLNSVFKEVFKEWWPFTPRSSWCLWREWKTQCCSWGSDASSPRSRSRASSEKIRPLWWKMMHSCNTSFRSVCDGAWKCVARDCLKEPTETDQVLVQFCLAFPH